LPNPHGSYGQGEVLTQGNVKDFGGGDYRDIMAGVDMLSRKYPIDSRRIGIRGHSYGGYMTMWAETQTQRFAAAVAGAGFSDWLSYYGLNDIDEWMIAFFGSSVYDDPAVYAKSDPMHFVNAVKTPTLILVGDRDGEVPMEQSVEWWPALATLHVPTNWWSIPTKDMRSPNPPTRGTTRCALSSGSRNGSRKHRRRACLPGARLAAQCRRGRQARECHVAAIAASHLRFGLDCAFESIRCFDRSKTLAAGRVLSGWFHATSKSADRCSKNICFWNEEEDEEDGNGVAHHYPEHSGKKKGGGPVRGTQESDRIASLAPAPNEVRAGAVLPGSRGPEHQAASAVPQQTDNPYYGSCHLAEVRRKNSMAAIIAANSTFRSGTFSTLTPVSDSYPCKPKRLRPGHGCESARTT
jgi:hypothetical protein